MNCAKVQRLLSFRLPGMAEGVAQVLLGLGVGPHWLVGHSAGAAIAVRLALDLAARMQPSVLMLDMHLPDMDGLALLAALRRLAHLRHVPAVVVSADAMPADIELSPITATT